MDAVREQIEKAYSNINEVRNTDTDLKNAVNLVINTLDCGGIRVAEKIGPNWVIHDWIKKAILLSFRLNQNQTIDAGWTKFHDKLDLKFTNYS